MLRIWMGRANTGKSRRILLEIKENTEKKRKSILLVPEHASHGSELDLCRACGAAASRYAEVLSLRQLAVRVLERTGAIQSRLEFCQGERNSSLYETPWGTMIVDIATTKLAQRIGERGGVMEIIFTIAINHQVTGENRFKVRVKETSR